MKINVIIPAGGSSTRFGNKNKLFESCKDSCVIVEAIKPFLEINEISKVIIAINSIYSKELLTALDTSKIDKTKIVLAQGGDTRTKSVKNAILLLDEDADYVLVHDSARPYIKKDLIERIILKAQEKGVALPVINSTNALVKVDGKNIEEVNRDNYKAVQTPLCAKKELLVKSYLKAEESFVDDLSVILKYGQKEVSLVEGDIDNIKITYSSDLKQNFLTGIGYDIHRMETGNGIKLLGVEIPCNFKFIAHSDGDVPVHALMDAILTAVGEKDIGHLFPVDDSTYDNANSIDLLKKVLDVANNHSYKVYNTSITIIAEKPMLKDYIDEMKNILSKVLQIPTDRIGLSCTTNEHVGNLGDCKSIASFATVLLNRI